MKQHNNMISLEKVTMKKCIFLSFLMAIVLGSCSVIQRTAKSELTDGYYTQKTATRKTKVYVDIKEDVIKIYPTKIIDKKIEVDTGSNFNQYIAELKNIEPFDFKLTQNSLDIDFLTIPLKLRKAQHRVPAQLNTNLNGAVYLGYRTDVYKVNYKINPLKIAQRQTNHFGYSFGIFSGFGNTFLSPTNTNNVLQQEYDGIVWSKGIAGIIGINNISIGLTVGFDNLLDKNKSLWIYEKKPWFGLAFGLNLN